MSASRSNDEFEAEFEELGPAENNKRVVKLIKSELADLRARVQELEDRQPPSG